MIRSATQTLFRKQTVDPAPLPSRKSRVLWTLGNALMLAGLYLMVYVGGVFAEAEYNREAARGDSDLPAPIVVSLPPELVPAAFTAPASEAFAPPNLNSDGAAVSSVPSVANAEHAATVSRVIIPSIDVDSKVVEVGWDVVEQDGKQLAVWQVAEYAVGQHKGSANPGEGENIVLAGHVGGYGKVFRDLFYVRPGDPITIYSNGQQYLYTVQQRLVLQEEGVSAEQQSENARYIEPTGSEMVTLVTCWPLTGKNKFSQRVIIRALPYGTTNSVVSSEQDGPVQWTTR